MSDKDVVMNKPLVSIIITSYNYKNYICNAIDSALNQKVDKEIIVIDDCSTDGTEECLKEKYNMGNFRYVKNAQNLGVAMSRNLGVQLARGKYIAFLDADDQWRDNKLKKQLKLLEEIQGSICYTGRILKNESGKIQGVMHVKNKVKYKELLHYNQITCSSVVMHRKIALEFPMESDKYHEDYLNWLKILQKYEWAYGIDEPLVIYTLSKKGKSRNKFKSIMMTYNTHRYLGMNRRNSLWYTICHLVNASLNLLIHKTEKSETDFR